MKNFSKEFYKKITKILQKNTNEFLKINYKIFLEMDTTIRKSCSSQATTRYCGMEIKLAKISENFR